MSSVNKVILIGHLGNDPEVRSTPSGTYVANLSIATNERWMDKQTSQWQERTEWHRVVLFARQAEVASQYLRKGSQVFIEGRLQTRKWQDQQGQDRYTTEIVGSEMKMLGGRGEAAGTANYGATGGSYAPPPASNPAPATPPPPPVAPAATGSSGGSTPPPNNFDDDIPF